MPCKIRDKTEQTKKTDPARWLLGPFQAPGTGRLFPGTGALPLLHTFDWAAWNVSQRPSPPPPASASLEDRVNWLLGSTTSGSTAGRTGGLAYTETGAVGSPWDYAAKLMERDSFAACKNGTGTGTGHGGDGDGDVCASGPDPPRIALSFGTYLTASLFVPCATTACDEITAPLPVVVFLHGYSYQMGYTGIYELGDSKDSGSFIKAVVSKHKVAVLAFDMSGMGMRQGQGGHSFYRRYPSSSRLGQMVGEVSAALDFVACADPSMSAHGSDGSTQCTYGNHWGGAYAKLHVPPLDRKRVYLVGYSLGAVVGLHAAALYKGVAGVAAFAGWTPMQCTANTTATGGNRMLYETHALVPRLGLFAGKEDAIPYDYAELIAAIAPRPTLLFAPLRNRFAVASAVERAAVAAGKAWSAAGADHAFTFTQADAPSDFKTREIGAALAWVKAQLA